MQVVIGMQPRLNGSTHGVSLKHANIDMGEKRKNQKRILRHNNQWGTKGKQEQGILEGKR